MGNACAVSVMTGMEGVGRKDLFELLGTDIVLALFMVASGVGNLSGGLAPEDVSGSLEGLSDHPSDRHKVERLTEEIFGERGGDLGYRQDGRLHHEPCECAGQANVISQPCRTREDRSLASA